MKQQENEETRLLKQKLTQLRSHRAGLEKIHSQRLRDLVESAHLARQLQRENEEDTATEEACLDRLKKQIADTQARLDTLLDQERATRDMLQTLYLDTPRLLRQADTLDRQVRDLPPVQETDPWQTVTRQIEDLQNQLHTNHQK